MSPEQTQHLGRPEVFCRFSLAALVQLEQLLVLTTSPLLKELRDFAKHAREDLDYPQADARALIDKIMPHDDLNVDEDAALSHGDDGSWVQVWMLVPNEDTDEDEDDEEGGKDLPGKGIYASPPEEFHN